MLTRLFLKMEEEEVESGGLEETLQQRVQKRVQDFMDSEAFHTKIVCFELNPMAASLTQYNLAQVALQWGASIPHPFSVIVGNTLGDGLPEGQTVQSLREDWEYAKKKGTHAEAEESRLRWVRAMVLSPRGVHQVFFGNPPWGNCPEDVHIRKDIVDVHKKHGAVGFGTNNLYVKFLEMAVALPNETSISLLVHNSFLSRRSLIPLRKWLLKKYDFMVITNFDPSGDMPAGVQKNDFVFDVSVGACHIMMANHNLFCPQVMYSEVWGSKSDKYTQLSYGVIDKALKGHELWDKNPHIARVPWTKARDIFPSSGVYGFLIPISIPLDWFSWLPLYGEGKERGVFQMGDFQPGSKDDTLRSSPPTTGLDTLFMCPTREHLMDRAEEILGGDPKKIVDTYRASNKDLAGRKKELAGRKKELDCEEDLESEKSDVVLKNVKRLKGHLEREGRENWGALAMEYQFAPGDIRWTFSLRYFRDIAEKLGGLTSPGDVALFTKAPAPGELPICILVDVPSRRHQGTASKNQGYATCIIHSEMPPFKVYATTAAVYTQQLAKLLELPYRMHQRKDTLKDLGSTFTELDTMLILWGQFNDPVYLATYGEKLVEMFPNVPFYTNDLVSLEYLRLLHSLGKRYASAAFYRLRGGLDRNALCYRYGVKVPAGTLQIVTQEYEAGALVLSGGSKEAIFQIPPSLMEVQLGGIPLLMSWITGRIGVTLTASHLQDFVYTIHLAETLHKIQETFKEKEDLSKAFLLRCKGSFNV
jgi:hypothetical protein